MTSNNDFRTIINGIDADIKIIQHIPTGYYNITKINNLIYEQKTINEIEPTLISVGLKKKLNNWFRNKGNKELIKSFKSILHIDKMYIILEKDIPFEYKGTYVHRYLYDSILSWIDKTYIP